jgi:hypothetical protein
MKKPAGRVESKYGLDIIIVNTVEDREDEFFGKRDKVADRWIRGAHAGAR